MSKPLIERLRALADHEEKLSPVVKLRDEHIADVREAATTLEDLVSALRKIAELRYVEDANEPFDDALDIADAAIARATGEA